MTTPLPAQRDLLRAAHDRLGRIAERHGVGEVLAEVGAAERRLAETEFRLVVLGEYKRGKSTLVNALLGAPVLPMGVVPLTSVVTELRHRPQPGITIELLDGRTRTIRPAELPDYVTEPGNPGNRKQVRRAIVHEPSPLLEQGVTIVDTPGVGSVFRHNSEVTYRFLEESDAVVFVMGADQPLSSEECRLLGALADITDRILFAVNRVDVLSPAEAAASVQFIRDTLETLEEHPPEMVFALSARQALEARLEHRPVPAAFADFEDALRRVLIGRKADLLIERARSITRRAADLMALRLRSERQAMQLEADRLHDVVASFRSAAAETRERLEESESLFRHRVHRIHAVELQQAADAARTRIFAALWPRVEAALRPEPDRSLHRQISDLSAEIGTWVVEELRRHHHDTEELVQRGWSRALEDHMARVQATLGQVVEHAERLLGMRLTVPAVVAPVSERARFYFRDWDYSGGGLPGHDWRLRLPRRWAESRARARARELLGRRIDQNLEAIRYDWVTRLDDATRRFQGSSREQLAAIVRAIAEALDRAERLASSPGAAARASDLDREVEAIVQVRASLRIDRPCDAPPGLGERPESRP